MSTASVSAKVEEEEQAGVASGENVTYIPDSAAPSPQQYARSESMSSELSDPQPLSQCNADPNLFTMGGHPDEEFRGTESSDIDTASEDDTASAKANYCPEQKRGNANQATQRKATVTKQPAKTKQPAMKRRPSKAHTRERIESLTGSGSDAPARRARITLRSPSKKRHSPESLETSHSPSKRRRSNVSSSDHSAIIAPAVSSPPQPPSGDDQLSACLRDLLSAQTTLRRETGAKDEKINTLEEEVKRLEEKVSRATEHYRNVAESKDKLFAEYSDLRQQVQEDAQQYDKVTDDWIMGRWTRLASGIHGVTAWMREDLNLQETLAAHTVHAEAMGHIVDYCSLENKKIAKKRGMIRRFVWDRLVQGIFGPDQEIWRDGMAQDYASFNHSLSIEALENASNRKQYSKMKSWLAHEMDRLCPPSREAIAEFADGLASDLSMFCEPDYVRGLRKSMLDITRMAVELWTVLRKSRAIFCVCSDQFQPRKRRQAADPNTMEIISTLMFRPPEERGLWFVQSPYLVKCGGADGLEDNFAQVMVVCKARVMIA
ncbi:uncharacterized protein F5Z01DRAFT_442480 [Emericellopsis atlantica]|uniref:Uncharacterized protein n=1 Tax=Emericellopsis atlantica TaxID=2614577 RepID=A0A9P7ZSN5_9HYPO|nr:uncharacterized protein F5Z01DRAFT_442480 [Emericellopsis atlantica]KAG9256955.1 hypothetical protein F5Z01DRAFT_442480 [Emericellopsis atlantica]